MVRQSRSVFIRLKEYAVFICICVLSLGIRANSFYLSHSSPDEVFYVSMAMKLEREGITGYNFGYTDLGLIDNTYLKIRPSLEAKGGLLKFVESRGAFYYNEPLFHIPPLFSFLLSESHKILSDTSGYMLVHRNLGPAVFWLRPPEFRLAQYYAVVLPIIFHLLLLWVVYILGREFFSPVAGLLGGLLIAFSPVDILTSQRIWPDEALAVFVGLCALFYLRGLRSERISCFVLSGLCAGLGVLTNYQAGFMVIIIASYFLWQKRGLILSGRWFLLGRDKGYLFFILTFFTICLWWFLLHLHVYGTFLYRPSQRGLAQTVEWFRYVCHRPWYTYLVGIPLMLPVFILGYLRIASGFFKRNISREESFLVFWFLLYMIILSLPIVGGKEQRYMLGAYPSLGLLTSLYIEKAWKGASLWVRLGWGFFLASSLIHGLHRGWSAVVAQNVLIPLPF